MNAKLLISTLAATVLSAAIAGPAAAISMVSGWDFSQYSTDGFLSLDEVTLSNTLTANYSDLDPTFGAGAESAAFGTMHLDGLYGSTDTPLDFADPFVASAAAGGSLTSNKTAPAGSDFDSFTILLNEQGQTFANPFAMAAVAAATVVFEANLISVPEIGDNWSVSFGARTFSGTSAIGIAFSTDGVNFTPFSAVNLTTVDTLYNVVFGGGPSEQAFVRLSFDPANGQPFIDNVAISANLTTVPEPSTLALLSLGLVGLSRIGRRRA